MTAPRLAFAILAVVALPVLANAQNSLLPGGASSLQETHQDWQVICVVREKARTCVVSQQQSKRDTNQRVLTVEYSQDNNNSTNGMLIMPFGLLLSAGITLQVDEKVVSKPLPFRTCLPAGCIVPLTLDKSGIEAQRLGTTLKIVAMSSDNNQPVQLAVSLKGLADALDRVREISSQDGFSSRR